jgi:Mn-dependent DtxR family transcriptional regulator
MNEIIPADVRDFIIRHIHSIAQLEALLLLRGSPEKNWQANDIARRLYISEQETAEAVRQLCKDKFLRFSDGAYHYEPGPDHKRSIDRLASIYSRHLIPVTNMIHGKAHRIRQFSDAFRLRKGEE